jgi:hypothetical protein
VLTGTSLARVLASAALASEDFFHEGLTEEEVAELARLAQVLDEVASDAHAKGEATVVLAYTFEVQASPRSSARSGRIGADADRLRLALRNVRGLAKRLRRTDPVNADHLLRFCDDAGVVDSILRGSSTGEGDEC